MSEPTSAASVQFVDPSLAKRASSMEHIQNLFSQSMQFHSSSRTAKDIASANVVLLLAIQLVTICLPFVFKNTYIYIYGFANIGH